MGRDDLAGPTMERPDKNLFAAAWLSRIDKEQSQCANV
jgi:hypothetical protein